MKEKVIKYYNKYKKYIYVGFLSYIFGYLLGTCNHTDNYIEPNNNTGYEVDTVETTDGWIMYK